MAKLDNVELKITSEPKERDEQKMFFRLVQYMTKKNPFLILCNSSMNGAKRTKRQGGYAKKEGMKSGVPDIHLPIARGEYHSLYIELKRKTSGSLSHEQRFWLNTLNSNGNMAVMCRGHEEAVKVLKEYINEADNLEEHIEHYSVDWDKINGIYKQFK